MEWRRAPTAQGFEVSEYGDVQKVGGRRVKGFIDSDGYLRYSLTHDDAVRRAVAAHRLVALAFIGPPPSEGHEVAHGNGSRVFCHYDNLRWATCVENHADRVEHGTDAVGERNGRATITEQDVRDIRREYREIKTPGSGRRVAELDEKYAMTRSQIIRIATRQAWRHVA